METSIFNANIKFTKSEKKVYDYVINNYEEVIYKTITELSHETGVGETTVLRFCRKLGFTGYQEFKLALTQEIYKFTSSDTDNFENLGEFSEVVSNTINNSMNVIKETARILDEQTLSAVVKLILESNRILLVGSSMSGNSALDAQNRLMRIGINAEYYSDTHLELMSSNTLNENDLLIAFSVSGSTKNTIQAIEFAKQNKAKIIVITNKIQSKAASLADIVLITKGRESPLEGGSLPAKISQLCIINIIYNLLVYADKKKADENRRKTSEAIAVKSY
ncbi:Transcriptional regulator [[Clostridium] ultunense Esp]|nr:Transcriptional regulator [[Clostridium] ultunense Esp]